MAFSRIFSSILRPRIRSIRSIKLSTPIFRRTHLRLKPNLFAELSRNYSLFTGRLFENRRTMVSSADAPSSDANFGKFERLPTVAKPVHYSLSLKPDLKNFTYDGEETILLDITKSTNFLKFYSSQLKITDAHLKSKEGELANLPIKYDERWQTVQIDLPKELAVQSGVTLTMKFEGKLKDNMKGFYRSQYKTANGETAYLASTQFESTSAREAFPCWDEPLYKSKFDITLIVPKDKVALSNMPEISTEERDGLKVVKFDTTPVMSSYLVAFVVGDFDHVENVDSNGVRVRVYALPGRKEQGEFALEVATKALPYFGDYFNVRYSLPKCDLVAIPDFQMGAMENWGLVTYREVALLVDPKNSSTAAKEQVALTVAHELAHMWFGNLVTMEWWTDLWLKEGYATWMEYYLVDWLFPHFDIWTQFVNHETGRALELDSLKNSHPIEVPINDPDEVEEIYDGVSYAKGASVIRMLHNFLGDDAFREGLRAYLAKFAHRNAVTQDLWASLSASSGKNVAEIMGNWTKQMGFPVVKVTSRQEGDKRILHLQQRRFIADGSEDEENTLWQIPISIATASNPNKVAFKLLLKEKEQDFTLDGIKADEWVQLNAGSTGYYRVQYSDEMLRQILPAIKAMKLKATDRYTISGDIFALVRAGLLSATSFLDLLEVYEDETDYTVLSDITSSIGTLGNCLERTDYLDKFDAFCRKLYKKIGDKLGWDPKPGESHTDALLRPMVLGRLGRSGDESVIKEVRRRFQEYVDGKTDMVPDLRRTVFTLIGKYDGQARYEDLQKIYETSELSEIQRTALIALSRSELPELQQRVLDYGMSDKVRLQDRHIVFFGLSTNARGQETAWDYFKNNFKTLIEKTGSPGNILLVHMLKLACGNHCSEEKAKEIEEYFRGQETSAALNRPIKQSLESVRLNAGLLKRDAENVRAWLTKKGY